MSKARSMREEIKCDQCDFVGEDIPSFIKHIRSGHTEKTIGCQYCNHLVESRDELMDHMYEHHAEIVMIHTTAKQVNDMSEKFETFGGLFNQIFETLNVMKQEIFIMRNNQVENSSAKNITRNERPPQRAVIDLLKSKPEKEERLDHEISKDNEDVKERETYSSKVKKNLDNKDVKVKDTSASKVKENSNVENVKNEESCIKNILMVADSHSYNLDRNVFKDQTNTDIDLAIAFTVDEDEDAKYSNKNFLKVVPERLKKKEYDTLIMQAGSNEISNINVKSPPLNITLWERKVEESRRKVFKLAQKSLKNNPSLKKVLILKSLPRFDPSTVDPSSIKSKLNNFGNAVYDSMWLKSGCPKNIQIVDQQLDCQGPLREKRFGNPGSVGCWPRWQAVGRYSYARKNGGQALHKQPGADSLGS